MKEVEYDFNCRFCDYKTDVAGDLARHAWKHFTLWERFKRWIKEMLGC